MPNIVDRFGQLVDDAIPKPELARQLLLLGYRAKDVQLLLAPEKELTPRAAVCGTDRHGRHDCAPGPPAAGGAGQYLYAL